MPLAFSLDSTIVRQLIPVLDEVIADGEATLDLKPGGFLPPEYKGGLKGFQEGAFAHPDAMRIATQLYAVKTLRSTLQEALLHE